MWKNRRHLLEDGAHHRARVRAIIPDENPASHTRPFRFIFAFTNLNLPLAFNQSVTLARLRWRFDDP